MSLQDNSSIDEADELNISPSAKENDTSHSFYDKINEESLNYGIPE
jgi:hypothetical protein